MITNIIILPHMHAGTKEWSYWSVYQQNFDNIAKSGLI